MIDVGNNELGGTIGKEATCPHCGGKHVVKYGHTIMKDGVRVPSNKLGYIRCDNDDIYLVAVDGKEIR